MKTLHSFWCSGLMQYRNQWFNLVGCLMMLWKPINQSADGQSMSKADSICTFLYPKHLLQNTPLILPTACRIFTWLGWVCRVSPRAELKVHARCAEWAAVSGTSPLQSVQGFKYTVFMDENIFIAEISNWSILLEADNMDQYKGFTNWGSRPHVGSPDLQNGLVKGTILKRYIWN